MVSALHSSLVMDLNSLSSIPPAELGAVAVDLSNDAFQEYMWLCGRQTGSQDGSANRAEMTVSLSLPISYSGIELVVVLPCHLCIAPLQLLEL